MRKIASIVLLLVWLLVIFMFSSDNGDESSSVSEECIKTAVTLFTDIKEDSNEMKNIVEKYSFPVRKLAHFTEYFILGVIVLNVFLSFKINRRILIYTGVFCILIAILDEFHQSFVVGRDGNIKDVLLDSSGSLIGSYLICRFYMFKDYFKKIN